MNSRITLVTFIFFCAIFHGNAVAEISSTGPLEKTIPQITKQEDKVEVWTCSMHPHIRMPKPGKCPICGMTLIPVSDASDEEAGPRELTMSEAAKKLAQITTDSVERKYVDAQVRMVGKVDYDETRVGYITAWVAGRLDKLYVDYTGVPVKKGDHMVFLYSPELLAAQEELLQALRSVRKSKGTKSKYIRNMAYATLSSAREKLRLWGLKSEQIKEIEKKTKPSEHMTILAPMSGIVIHKNAFEGMYVKTGTKIYTIADLSRLWVKLDAYESDLIWIRYGQKVEFTTEAYPGEVFKGQISFIDPILNAKTRTVKVRVNVDNPNGKLKPEMFVRAIVHANVAQGGKVMDPELAGKWICPMHPDFLSDQPGNCEICGMSLLTTESLGYVTGNNMRQAPLVVPSSSVLKTGKRAVVYVEIPGRKRPTYEGREVVLGPRAGSYYIVYSGLEEGERVVTNGNFKIDSALQIMAKPSMMSPKGGVLMKGHANHGGMNGAKKKKQKMSNKKMGLEQDHQGHEHKKIQKKEVRKNIPKDFLNQMSGLLKTYLSVHKSLSEDDFKEAAKAAQEMNDSLSEIDMKLLTGQAHMDWMEASSGIKKNIESMLAKDIQQQRTSFAQLSEEMARVLDRFGYGQDIPLFQFKCSMAFGGRGAIWLQEGKEIRNPYLGEAMLGCGEMIRKY